MGDWGGSNAKGANAANYHEMYADETACLDIDDKFKEDWEIKGKGKSRAEKKKAAKARKKASEPQPVG